MIIALMAGCGAVFIAAGLTSFANHMVKDTPKDSLVRVIPLLVLFGTLIPLVWYVAANVPA